MKRRKASASAAMICLILLGVIHLWGVPAAAEEVQRFHYVSQPSLSTDIWVVHSDLFIVPAYRHLFASVLDGEREYTVPSARGRWQAYVSVGPILDGVGNRESASDDITMIRGGYAAIGWNVSFESARRLARRSLIPYVGTEVGIISFQSAPDSSNELYSGGSASVMLGLHLYSGPRFSTSSGIGWIFTTIQPIPNAARGMIAVEVLID